MVEVCGFCNRRKTGKHSPACIDHLNTFRINSQAQAEGPTCAQTGRSQHKRLPLRRTRAMLKQFSSRRLLHPQLRRWPTIANSPLSQRPWQQREERLQRMRSRRVCTRCPPRMLNVISRCMGRRGGRSYRQPTPRSGDSGRAGYSSSLVWIYRCFWTEKRGSQTAGALLRRPRCATAPCCAEEVRHPTETRATLCGVQGTSNRCCGRTEVSGEEW